MAYYNVVDPHRWGWGWGCDMIDNETKKSLINRLSTAEGHIAGIKRMIEDGKPCEDILMQLSAVESSVNRLGKIILKNHLNTCVKEGVQKGDGDILNRFNNILDKYL